ncbi:molybdopterin-containing oxidoreductase family protein [Novosphingobium pentaromativorans]|uniref:4Fe-4S Mo/W bis-MGD-type domain-containing protein n=1 Tax=Novosphingobium pentaromativorans US6-1 TaxID=1088721 RepID=G6EGG7_9SPHN|nr:molybdopterin-dependent oxidoreductase [Novosphingobium pentaromativorans]EHJ59618.1 hypothetical protein NSU_3501 [Novosphingobium pentaromativorans US6-1]
MRIKIDDDGKLAEIRGDKSHPLSQGYACIKGIQAVEQHNGPNRLLHAYKRDPDGNLQRIGVETALDEVAQRLRSLIERHGPQTIAAYRGNPSWYDNLANIYSGAFMSALGSDQIYSANTLDQSAKVITSGRLGSWHAGRPTVEESDVWMIVGGNPLVSLAVYGFYSNPLKTIKDARARGLKLIVIDPRRTETAQHADIHLQPYPGEDPTLLAGMLRIILEEGWHDEAFCDRFVDGLDRLKANLASFTDAYVETRTGVSAALVREAAETFARIGTKGNAGMATGSSMAPRGNLSDHLTECLNVVCGRYRREGERVPHPGVFCPRRPRYAEVNAPTRPWERGPKSRAHGHGQIVGEMVSSGLADDIMSPGEDRIRAMIAVGANPAATIPDQRRVVKALRSLDLLVTTDPVLSATAQMADYIFAPRLMYERPGAIPWMWGDDRYVTVPFAGYTPAIVDPPADSEVVDEWYVYWSLAKRLGLQMEVAGVDLDMENPPSTEEIYAMCLRDSPVPFEEIKARRGEILEVEPQFVEPARPEAQGRFAVMPADVVNELKAVRSETATSDSAGAYAFRLTVRRLREVSNTMGRELSAVRRRMPYNPAYLHPDDMAEIEVAAGDEIEIVSETGTMAAIAQPDADLRRGVVSMANGWGGLPDDPKADVRDGTNTNLLIGLGHNQYFDCYNRTPRMSAIPVNVRPCAAAAPPKAKRATA